MFSEQLINQYVGGKIRVLVQRADPDVRDRWSGIDLGEIFGCRGYDRLAEQGINRNTATERWAAFVIRHRLAEQIDVDRRAAVAAGRGREIDNPRLADNTEDHGATRI